MDEAAATNNRCSLARTWGQRRQNMQPFGSPSGQPGHSKNRQQVPEQLQRTLMILKKARIKAISMCTAGNSNFSERPSLKAGGLWKTLKHGPPATATPVAAVDAVAVVGKPQSMQILRCLELHGGCNCPCGVAPQPGCCSSSATAALLTAAAAPQQPV